MDTEPMAELPPEVKQQMTRYKAPPGLERRVRHMLVRESAGAGLMDRIRSSVNSWLPLGASFACGILVAVSVFTYLGGAGEDDQIEQQVVSAHVRSLMGNHLMDVASTDQHTVKPWFTGKLDFAPPVIDLATIGFPLVGGRLDYVHDRPVAALVYQRRGHTINVFVMPAEDAKSMSPTPAMRHGYQVAEWQGSGMQFWAVSDIGREEMKQFAQAMKTAD